MATNTAKKAPAPKRSAPKAKAATVQQGTAPTKAAQGSKAAQASAPTVALYQLGPWPVQQRGHRAFARAVAADLTKANPKGFTLAAYREALVAQAKASNADQPKGGWQGHNMPTWAAHEKQGWLKQVN